MNNRILSSRLNLIRHATTVISTVQGLFTRRGLALIIQNVNDRLLLRFIATFTHHSSAVISSSFLATWRLLGKQSLMQLAWSWRNLELAGVDGAFRFLKHRE
jgi:hypothetical protein